jgi:hypothetical protein
MSRANFNIQFSSREPADEAVSLIEREFAPKILAFRGYRALPRGGNRLAYARKRTAREFALAAATGVAGGVLETFGPVGDFVGWGVEARGLFYNASERIMFTVTANAGGSTINVHGRAELDVRRLVDQVATRLKARVGSRTTCARCANPTTGALWCSDCIGDLDLNQIAADGSEVICTVAENSRQMWETGDLSLFWDVFAADCVAQFPDEDRTMSRIQLEASMEQRLPLFTGCSLTLKEIFGDGPRTYWLAWILEHPRCERPRYAERVQLDGTGHVRQLVVHLG